MTRTTAGKRKVSLIVVFTRCVSDIITNSDRHAIVQGGAGGLSVGLVDLDLECSTILLGQ